MPRRLPQDFGGIHRGGIGVTPKTTYTFGENPDEREARVGAASLQQNFAEALAMEQHRIAQNYERLHYELEVAHMRRQETQDSAKAEQRLKYEAMMEEAIPKLYAIDPADKNAAKQLGDVLKQYPHLAHIDPGLPSLMPAVEQYQRLIEGARKTSEGEDFKTQAAKERSADIATRQKELADVKAQHAKELLDVKDQMKKAAGPTDAVKTAYQKSVNNSTNYQKQLDDTEKLIKEQEAKPQRDKTSETHYQNLLGSRDEWQRKLDKETATKDALELVHPQLNPAYKPPEAATTDQQKAPPTPPSPAPVFGGTATPSGDMVPFGGTANGAAQPVPGETPPAKKRPTLDDLSPYTQGGGENAVGS